MISARFLGIQVQSEKAEAVLRSNPRNGWLIMEALQKDKWAAETEVKLADGKIITIKRI
jgi:hypothetical protein